MKSLVALSANLLLFAWIAQADLQRTEVTTTNDWVVNACEENGKPHGAEIWRTYSGKNEVHLRLRSNQEGVFIDATADWSKISPAKSQAVEIRVNSAKGKPIWSGDGKVIEDADGLSWVSVNLEKSATGDMTEAVLEAMMEKGKTLYVSIGKKDPTQWNFGLGGIKAAYDAMWEYLQKTGAAAIQ